jgi:thiamine-phosphate pyrophosphorylase
VPEARHVIVCYVTDRLSLEAPDPLVDPKADGIGALLGKIRVAIQAGADCVQIREKDLPSRALLELTRSAVKMASEAALPSAGQARVHVNDRLDVALAAGATGVQLGGESLPVGDAVRWCRGGNAPPQFEIGVSCHSLDAAREAERGGASYIFFGPVFDTPSKRAFGPSQGVQRLAEVCAAIRIPVVAIGGVNEENAAACIRAGASGIAAIRMFQKEQSTAALRKSIAALHK